MRRILPAVAAVLWLAGCGYVGDPLPPLANVPGPVTNLQARQQGSRILVQFTLPVMTTEGIAIKTPLRTDLRIGAGEVAKNVAGGSVKAGVAHYEIPAGEWAGKQVNLAARVAGANEKESAWTNFENLEVVDPPAAPGSVTARNAPDGVTLTWGGPAGTFRVWRREGNATEFTAAATVDHSEWTDRAAAAGKPVAYYVERVVKVSGGREATSDPSETAEITPKDTFPPAAPAGLRASAAPSSIELFWERNPEADVAGYRVYRAGPAGEFEKIADVGQAPAYSDRTAESGKMYRYAVSAVDQAGNEGARSAVVEAGR
jgi:hypothetical protein